MRRWTQTEAFAYYDGAEAVNVRWGWSAINPAKSVVVLTFWDVSPELNYDKATKPPRVTYDNTQRVYDRHGRQSKWVKHAGNTKRKEHIQHALDHLGGWVRAILCVPVDPNKEPREIVKGCRASGSLVGPQAHRLNHAGPSR